MNTFSKRTYEMIKYKLAKRDIDVRMNGHLNKSNFFFLTEISGRSIMIPLFWAYYILYSHFSDTLLNNRICHWKVGKENIPITFFDETGAKLRTIVWSESPKPRLYSFLKTWKIFEWSVNRNHRSVYDRFFKSTSRLRNLNSLVIVSPNVCLGFWFV